MFNNIKIKVSAVTFKQEGNILVFGDSREINVNNPVRDVEPVNKELAGENDMII